MNASAVFLAFSYCFMQKLFQILSISAFSKIMLLLILDVKMRNIAGAYALLVDAGLHH